MRLDQYLKLNNFINKMLFFIFIKLSVQFSCTSGRYFFNTTNTPDSNWIIDYGQANFHPLKNGGAYLSLSKPNNPNVHGEGIRISSKTNILYAKITIKCIPIAVPGAVTTFITMSDSKDEIDVEWVGHQPTKPQSNIFYKGIPEYGRHFRRLHSRPGLQTITIDWKSTSIQFSVNGQVQRIHRKDSKESLSPLTPKNERWFPNTPSKIQIGVWDTTGSPKGTQEWAGGPIPWNKLPSKLYAYYHYADIQCYDNKDRPVKQW